MFGGFIFPVSQDYDCQISFICCRLFFFFSPAASSFASTYSSSSNFLRTNCTPCMPWCVKHLTNSSLGIILLLYVCKAVLPLEFFIDATKEMQIMFEKLLLHKVKNTIANWFVVVSTGAQYDCAITSYLILLTCLLIP